MIKCANYKVNYNKKTMKNPQTKQTTTTKTKATDDKLLGHMYGF